MGILDRYTTDEDKEELAKNLNLPVDKTAISGKTTKSKKTSAPQTSKYEKKQAKNLNELDDKILSTINQFVDSYKSNKKTSRMIRIQDHHYRKLVSLRADGISVSEFVSFAVHLVLNSEDFENFLNILKK
ncbi:hypothetical protein BBI01_18045 [Chryseobacterium artocarpi]|uniref:Uncharacterized protein n=1 Tax=Chryseobacterium artocarpi TaxID=1414727 RepID=A0A1B8ZBW6_9FLAO|nr:hypothetical protein [Chryseobacterium artocarpi]OCA69111.1 hypothetical protein BBI01_18045 [Chryseobacterium artocarpi]